MYCIVLLLSNVKYIFVKSLIIIWLEVFRILCTCVVTIDECATVVEFVAVVVDVRACV